MCRSVPTTVWQEAAEQILWAMSQADNDQETDDGLDALAKDSISDEETFKSSIARCFPHMGKNFPDECVAKVMDRMRQIASPPVPRH